MDTSNKNIHGCNQMGYTLEIDTYTPIGMGR
jgi:hypothetical protein